MIEFANTIIAMTGSRSDVVHLPLPRDDPSRRKPDITLAQKELQWHPRVLVREGLALTVAYFQAELTLP